ncbi:putative tgf beta receptor associated protein [Diaporthe ampelina]|uniref:Putative tgf beta receptor associated protein n=1 Tax=Diaporthe ampelina TaxID=1214573 RepID=A0A0G2HI91_9PEZI|nr:putative tgf beta receptor associated protein [Diaporthe ampelina]
MSGLEMAFDGRATQDKADTSSGARRQPATGPFVLRTLLEDVPLSEDGDNDDVKINFVEYLGGNLYIGTSASELLHFVQIPPDPADKASQPVFILASRLRPTYIESSVAGNVKPGVQQILLLSRVQKACVLCNNTVTFYSLPELSPVFGTVRVKNCYWIGGLDLNITENENNGHDDGRPVGETILLSLTRKIQVVRVGPGLD